MNNSLDLEKINGQELAEMRNVETIGFPAAESRKDSLALIKKTFISKLKERAEKLCSFGERYFTEKAWELLNEEVNANVNSVVEPFGGWSMLREPSPTILVVVAQNPYAMPIIPKPDTKLTRSDVRIIWAAKYIVSARNSKSPLPGLDAMLNVDPKTFSNKEFRYDSCIIINALPFRTFRLTEEGKINISPGAIPSIPEYGTLGIELVERVLVLTQPKVVLTLGIVAKSILKHISEFRDGDAKAEWLRVRHPSNDTKQVFRRQVEEGVKILNQRSESKQRISSSG